MDSYLKLRSSHVFDVISTVLIMGLLSARVAECQKPGAAPAAKPGAVPAARPGGGAAPTAQPVPGAGKAGSGQYLARNCRKHTASIADYGAKGDGKTLNTKAFAAAITNLTKMAADGGAQLIIPAGKWLTGAFNLTASNFTLYLEKDAVILGSEAEADYPIMAPLPSYGLGRDNTPGRFSPLIFGTNLTDIVITGANGTIDGQGALWWDKFKKENILKQTRPYMIEILSSVDVQISNVTLVNSASWNIHPTYCSNVIIQGVTILAPVKSPNTDGINPDSCTNIKIEDCFIVSGDDCIAVKSGWDQYGIKYGMPTKQLAIKRLTCISPFSALVALGSELSGGIEDVRIEDNYGLNTESAIRIKTSPGRGAFVRDIFLKDMKLKNMEYVFWMAASYGQHPDAGFDPKAHTEIKNINFRDVVAENVNATARLEGMPDNPFNGVCISNVTIQLAPTKKEIQWNCTSINGVSSNVTPKPCDLLPPKGVPCSFPADKLPIESVQLKTCSI